MRAFLISFACAAFVFAQDASKLAEDPAVNAALDAAKRNEAHFIDDEQVRFCADPRASPL